MKQGTIEGVDRKSLLEALAKSPMLPDGFVEISLHREVSAPILEERLTVTVRGDDDSAGSILWALTH